MATMSMPPRKDAQEDEGASRGQARPTLERYRLQVDRQTKASFKVAADAEAAGRAIKKAHPIVQVAVYDAEKGERTLLS